MMYQMIFQAELESLYEMLEFIKVYGERSKLSTLALDQLTVGVEEALVNIISYAYPGEKKGTVEILCENATAQPGVKVIIKDQGVPFNPVENAPKSVAPASAILEKAETTLGGYGISIMVGMMDVVDYKRIDNNNILTLIKYTGAPA